MIGREGEGGVTGFDTSGLVYAGFNLLHFRHHLHLLSSPPLIIISTERYRSKLFPLFFPVFSCAASAPPPPR